MHQMDGRAAARTRILVVEDEKLVARDLSQTLEEMGYTVCGTACSADQALAIAESSRPDLALMDIHLEKGSDGIDAASRLREQFRVPVVFLTGREDDQTLQRALRAQPLGYVHKPVQTARLQSAIELALDTWRMEGELRNSNQVLSARMHALEERCTELALINEMGELFLICQSQAEIAAIAQQFGRKLFAGGSGVAYMVESKGGFLDYFAGWGVEDVQPILAIQECLSLRRGRPHRYAGGDDLRCTHLLASAARDSLCTPLIAGGDTMGMLSIDLPTGADPMLIELKQQLATAFGQQIAVAIANLRLRERLLQESIHDPLTGLFNRRYLDLCFARELRLASRKQESLSLVLLDVDHFKQLNDKFGHAAGDIVLREVGACMRRLLRLYDVPCRYGGEEIAVLLPGTSLPNAMLVAEKLRAGICSLSVRSGMNQLPAVTLSGGVAAFPDHSDDPATLLNAADAALYEAKAAGRDQVMIASQVFPRPRARC